MPGWGGGYNPNTGLPLNRGGLSGGGPSPGSMPTPYGGYPGVAGITPQEAEAQRQRETARLEQERQIAAAAAQQQAGIGGQSRLGSEQAGYGTAARSQEAGLQAAAEQRRFAQFSPYFDKITGEWGTGGKGGNLPREEYGGAQADAARQASFARAKDQAANIARSALTGLSGAMASRGISGSGIELGGMGDILGGAADQLGDVNREQLIQDLAQQQHVSDVRYGGGITQRGQDLQAEAARRQALMGLFNQMFGGDITARY